MLYELLDLKKVEHTDILDTIADTGDYRSGPNRDQDADRGDEQLTAGREPEGWGYTKMTLPSRHLHAPPSPPAGHGSESAPLTGTSTSGRDRRRDGSIVRLFDELDTLLISIPAPRLGVVSVAFWRRWLAVWATRPLEAARQLQRR